MQHYCMTKFWESAIVKWYQRHLVNVYTHSDIHRKKKNTKIKYACIYKHSNNLQQPKVHACIPSFLQAHTPIT